MFINKAKCARCGDIIESKSQHDFVSCSCGAIYVDGGDVCPRRGGSPFFFDIEFDKTIDFKGWEPEEGWEEKIVVAQPFSITSVTDYPSLDETTARVWGWFTDHNLSDPVMQTVKMLEEAGEIAHEISRGHYDTHEMVDALGDTMVTIIGLCHHLGITPAEALTTAYNEIKDRKGKVIDGSFVKEEE